MTDTPTPPTPPRRRRHGARRRTAQLSRSQGIVLTAVLGVITAVLVAVFFINLANRPGGKLKGAFGSDTFDVGRAATFAPLIARQGPLLFPDLLRRGHDIFVQHQGPDVKQGWSAFEAHPPDDPKCAISWKSDHFVDCRNRQYPPDGTGLVRYKADVNPSGHVIVDLRASQPPTSQ